MVKRSSHTPSVQDCYFTKSTYWDFVYFNYFGKESGVLVHEIHITHEPLLPTSFHVCHRTSE